MSLATMLLFRPFFPSTQLVEPLVSCATLVMVLPTPSPSTKVSPFPTPSPESRSPVETSPLSWPSFCKKEAINSSLQPNLKSSETSRKSFASSPLTTRPPSRTPTPALSTRRTTNFPMVRSLPLEMRDSDALSTSSNPSR